MTPEEFILDPWKDASAHPLYRESFLHMRPAPEYASGEVLLASLYRNVGFSGHVSEGRVPANGRDLGKRLDRGRRPEQPAGTGLGVDVLKNLLEGALGSPKQPNQTARRFLQVCPIVPDAAMYSLSARLSANSWNPGELVSRVLGFGEPNPQRREKRWHELFHQLSVGASDDVWARFLDRELSSWRSEELGGAWHPPDGSVEWPAIEEWHKGAATIPAGQFAEDLDRTLSLKNRLTRRQWISMVESILRLGAAAHVLWVCQVGAVFSQTVDAVLDGDAPPTEAELRESFDVGEPFWRYGQVAGRAIKGCVRGFVMSRLAINLLLWHCENVQGGLRRAFAPLALSSIPSMTHFLRELAEARPRLERAEYRKLLLKVIDESPRVVDGKDGIGSNIGEFLRHVLGQRQTSEPGMDSYDQGYYLRKRGHASQAPWVVSLGPVSVLTLVHCCTHLTKGPRTVEDFCRHIARYGIEIRAQDVPGSDLGQTLRNLGLVFDSPDAEGGMVLVSPFKEESRGVDL